MNEDQVKALVLSAITLLKSGRRDEAAEQLGEAITKGPPTGAQWRNIGRLAGQIGEIKLSLEASRRFAATAPVKLSSMLSYWKELTAFGRPDIVEQEIARYDQAVGDHPAVLHIRGQLAAQKGEFEAANGFYLRVIPNPEFAPQAWFSLCMINDMNEHRDWIDQMVALERDHLDIDQAGRARLLNGLGKAFHDCGDYKQAMVWYQQGALARSGEAQYQPEQLENFARSLINDFNPAGMQALTPPEHRERAAIFVNGLPRSGTTLVEQILVAHSAVHDGAEVNLARSALLPAGDCTYSSAIAYQRARPDLRDPWGAIAKQYRRMLTMRFRTDSLVVDKSLTQSHIMGLLAHALPDCPIVWLRRNPADVALSCFRTFFTSPLPWCWRFEDIGHFMAVEDSLFAHWTRALGDRILVVDYQELVRDPAPMIRRLADHAGLAWEEGMERFYDKKRSVRTASLQQVRQPISTARINQADAYAQWMDGFWRSYEDTAKRLSASN